MREGTWFVSRWEKTCPKCELNVGADDAVYCPNCGKWLGKIRQHVKSFAAVAMLAIVAALGVGVQAFVEGGSFPLSVLALMAGTFGLGMLSVTKPFGKWVLDGERKREKAREWNEARRETLLEESNQRIREKISEEGQEEREREANADSGIDVQIKVMGAEKVQEALLKNRDRIAAMMDEVASNPHAEDPDDENSIFHLIIEKIDALRDRTEELMEKAERLEETDSIDINSEPMLILRSIAHAWAKRVNPKGDNECEKGASFGCSRLCTDDHRILCTKIAEARKFIEKKKQPITFTTVSKGLDTFTIIECSCGRKNRVIHMRDVFTCPCGARYVLTSKGWRPEKRCCLIFASEICGVQLHSGYKNSSCDKTIADCRRHKNVERFSP